MKILLTGATGFLGSSLLKKLSNSGYEVIYLCRNNSNLYRINKKFTNTKRLIVDDWSDFSIVNKHFGREECVIIHCAWQGVAGSERNQKWQFFDNVSMCNSLLKGISELNVKKFINFGSHAEYGPLNKIISEDDNKMPSTMYGLTKKIINNLLLEYFNNTGVEYINLRIFNLYGPFDNDNWFIPYIINNYLKGLSPELTKCEQIWDYLYIDDFCNLVSLVVENNIKGEFNAGSGIGVPLTEVVNCISGHIPNSPDPNFGIVKYRDDQVMHLQADISKISKATSWLPEVSLKDGILDTINYFKNRG